MPSLDTCTNKTYINFLDIAPSKQNALHWVKQHGNLHVQEREGGKIHRDRPALLTAVLKHPSMLGCYLAGSEPDEHHSTVASCTAELLAQILDHAQAAEGAGSGSISSAWSEVLAASKPYLSR